MNEVSVRSTPNPMPTGQRYGSIDLLLPFESRHYSHQSLVTRAKMVIFSGVINVSLVARALSALLTDGLAVLWLCDFVYGGSSVWGIGWWFSILLL